MLKEYGRIVESIETLSRAIEMCRLQPRRAFSRCACMVHVLFSSPQRAIATSRRRTSRKACASGTLLHMRDAAWYVAMARLKDAEGSIFFFGGDLAAAEEAFKASLELSELAGDTHGMPDGLVNLGGVAYTRGDHAAAAVYYERALAAAKKARWTAREAVGHSNLGQVKLALGEHEVAAQHLEIACRLGEEGGYLDVLADTARALAEVELARGAIDVAIERAGAGDRSRRAIEDAFLRRHGARRGDGRVAREAASGSRPERLPEGAPAQGTGVCHPAPIGQEHGAEAVTRRFGQGSNATIDA